jgi:hypothetical protein
VSRQGHEGLALGGEVVVVAVAGPGDGAGNVADEADEDMSAGDPGGDPADGVVGVGRVQVGRLGAVGGAEEDAEGVGREEDELRDEGVAGAGDGKHDGDWQDKHPG